MKSFLLGFAVAALGAANGLSQTPTPSAAVEQPKPKAPWELEWAYLSKYHDANLELPALAPGQKRVVFLGDSITEAWGKADPGFFAGNSYVDRGIGGQTTSQMLVRFRQDVIELKPAAVVILGGTNDIAENGGKTTLEAIEENLQSMVELARVNGIRVVLASVLPAFDYPWRRGLKPADKIYALDQWIEAYCAEKHLVYLDCYPSMVDGRRGLRPELSEDGVHPNAAGYAIMEPMAEKAVADVLRRHHSFWWFW
jgi:lysophospholipase L1-like esterase